MPNYRWTCFACDHSNPPGVTRCATCGFTATPTAAQISAARQASGLEPAPPTPPAPKAAQTPAGPPTAVDIIVMLLFGALCLYAAYDSIAYATWPRYMPFLIDTAGLMLGPYVGGALAGLLGLSVIAACGVALAKLLAGTKQ